MDEFTNEEKERINLLYASDFKDVTPDDAQLIVRWERFKNAMESEHAARIEAIKQESAARLEESKQRSKISRETLMLRREAAMERLKAVRNGKA